MYWTMQWHITTKCQQRCKHCYMFDSETYKSEKNNELTYKQCLKVLNNFVNSCKKLGASPSINFSGGDALCRKDFFKLLEAARKKHVKIGILGNSWLITEKIAKRLKKIGIACYQISLDGLEKTHDYFRKKGSFKDALRAFKILNKHGIRTATMFTLSKKNAKDLIPLLHKIDGKINVFGFSRIVPEGTGKKLKKELLKPKEYKKLLQKVSKVYEKLEKKKGTHYVKKDHLFTLLEYEEGKIKPRDNKIIYRGCGMGCRHITVIADGNVMVCRRLPIIIGNALKDNLANLFIHSRQLNKIRNIEKLEKCGKCELLRYCRGCPAIPYALTGDYYASDPQCWKTV